jgi:hypothetical protein
MANERHWLKRRMIPLLLILFAGLFYLRGALLGNRGDWIHLARDLTGTLMLTIIAAALLVCQTLDEKFERLEHLLDEQRLHGGEPANRLTEAKEGRIAETP